MVTPGRITLLPPMKQPLPMRTGLRSIRSEPEWFSSIMFDSQLEWVKIRQFSPMLVCSPMVRPPLASSTVFSPIQQWSPRTRFSG